MRPRSGTAHERDRYSCIGEPLTGDAPVAVSAVDQLETMANKRQYRDAANLLEARRSSPVA